MTLLSISLLGLAALFFLALYKLVIYPVFLSPLSMIPNAHWSAPLASFWVLCTRYRCRENRSLHAAHLRLGPVIRIAPNELSVNDIGGVRTVYSGGFEKGDWYSIFDNYGVPCMFSSWYSKTHSVRKRMISNIYSKSTIQSSPALAEQARTIIYDRVLPILEASANSKSSTGIDILEIWNATNMDFITAYLFGLKNSSNFLQNEAYRRHWLSLYHSRKTYPYFTQELPRLTRFLKSWGIRLIPKWVDEANQELENWCKVLCESSASLLKSDQTEHLSSIDEPVVMKTLLAGIEKEENTKGDESVLSNTTLQFKDLSVASEMLDHLAAGHETSAITLTYLTWHLSQNIRLQDTLRVELLSIWPNIQISHGMKELPDSKRLDSLPFLHAVLMETLRLHAAIPGGQPRMTPYPSCTLGPYTDIPGGVRVAAQAHSVHRNPDVFPKPEKWDYMRWLDDRNGYTEEQKRERDRWFWAFSSGGRMCVGSNFAMHSMKLLVAAVYSNFRTHIVDDEGIEQEDGYTCAPIGNKLYLRFETLE